MAEPGVVWPLVVVSFFWLVVGGVIPWVIPKGENRGIIQVMLVITAASCYMFWLCTFLMQLNPLIGPILENRTAAIVKEVWMS